MQRIFLWIAGLFFALASMFVAWVALDQPTTPPFLDETGRPIEGSVASIERLGLGGHPQWVLTRGRSAANPLLIVLHGGPGMPEAELFRAYNSELENHFLVVHWHQRGAGWSYGSEELVRTLTIDQIYADLEELIDVMRRRHGQGKVFVLGHSWGSYLGIRYVAEHPDKVIAYVGVGQVSNMLESEKRSCDFVRAQATAAGDEAALADLEDLCALPVPADKMMRQRAYVSEYGGDLKTLSMGDLVWAALGTDEGSPGLFPVAFRGALESTETLWPELMKVNLFETYRHFDVPVYFVLGRADRQVPSDLGAEYWETIEAPCKALIWFDDSAHSPPFEEPERFNDLMIQRVKAGACESD